MLSTDATVFDAGSRARARMEEYAKVLDTLSIIVFCGGTHTPVIEEKLSLYPTDSSSRFFRIRDAVKIGKRIGSADVVTVQDPFETGWAGMKIALSLRIPLHVQVHTDFLEPSFTAMHWPLNAIRLWIAPRVLRHAARIRTVSGRIKSHIENIYHPVAPISVLPIFAETEKLTHIKKTHHPKFKTMLLVVSRLEKEKRIHLAIEALKQARDAGLDCGLVIVGSGREEESLKRIAHVLGVSEWVEFDGFQNNLIPYYAMAQVLLYPGAPYEDYGMGIIEALAAGVPVLASDVGVAREAGAEIVPDTSGLDFGPALIAFLKKGAPMPASLYSPYASKEEYLKKFADDLMIPRPLQ